MEDSYGGEQPLEPGGSRPIPSGEPSPEAHGADPADPPVSEPPGHGAGGGEQPPHGEPPSSATEPPQPPAGHEQPGQGPNATQAFGSEPPGYPMGAYQPPAGQPGQGPDGTQAFGSEPPGSQAFGSEPPGYGMGAYQQPGGQSGYDMGGPQTPAGHGQPGPGAPPLPGSQGHGSPGSGDDVLTGGYWPPPPPGNLPPPPGGYGYGGYPGYGGYGGYGGWPGGPQRPRRRGRALLAVAAVAIVAAAAGAATTVALRNSGSNQPTGSSGPGASSVPQPGSKRPPLNNTGVNKPNVSAISHQVSPSVADITSSISEPQSVTAQGTGIVLNPDGLVLTNNHVIADASKVTAQVGGAGQKYPAKVLGTDVSQDVALLQLQGAPKLKAANFGDSSKVAVGDGVVDLGNACGVGGAPTVTSGAITALNRSIQAGDQGNASSENLHGMMQTDAAITEGDSGGPLVNSAGQVIGMITAAEGTGSSCQQTSNMGFAIPVDTALSIARQIAAGHGSPTIQVGPRAGLGVTVEDASSAAQGQGGSGGGPGGGPGIGGGPGGGLGGGPGGGLGNGYTPPVNSGAVIVQVVQGSPAQAAGLTTGDVITGVNGTKVASSSALSKALANYHPGDHVSITYVNANGQQHTTPVSLGTVPPA